ncbi:MAG: nucleoside hydrolase [Armatimonadetes bacterium]|nr:nucleoside hydrolase [Armatimonadota bacterium]
MAGELQPPNGVSSALMNTKAALLLLLLVLSPAWPAEPAKVILDTDIGGDIDDAWALGFLLSYPGFEPVGITITHGNTPARARIACKILYRTGRNNIPVAVGRKTDEAYSYQFTWAEDFDALRPIGQSAARFLVENIKRFPGQITLIAVGPLENLADALRMEPELGKYVKRVVLMSGCIYGRAGGRPPIAEWNVRASVEDSRLVYAAGLPLTIVPLDSTTLVRLTEQERARVRDYDSPLTFSLEALYRLWHRSPQSRMTLHDQLAVAQAASPGTFFARKETLPLVVDEEGFTRIDQARGKPVTVCLEPKRDEFMDYYIGHLVAQKLGM